MARTVQELGWASIALEGTQPTLTQVPPQPHIGRSLWRRRGSSGSWAIRPGSESWSSSARGTAPLVN